MNKSLLMTPILLVCGSCFIVLSYFYIDIPLANYCRHLHPGVRSFFGMVTELGQSTWYLGASLFCFLLFRYVYKNIFLARRILFLFVAIAGSGIIVNIFRFLAGRYRPEMLFTQGAYGFEFFQIKSNALSFPSGHTTTAFALAMVLIIFWRRYWPFFVFLATLIAASRVIITAHFLSDVVAGAYLGLFSVIFLKKYWGFYFLPKS
ncbi:MAG: phosphatase PAP2 family protein [bacterium]